MNCQEAQTLLHAYVDGELELSRNLEIEQHLQSCTTCAQAHARLEGLRATLRSDVPYYTAPRHLRPKIQAGLWKAGPRRSGRPMATPRWLALAACVAVILLGGWTLNTVLTPRSDGDVLVREVVAAHIRSLMLDKHQLDVESSDRHTVKPWFKGKIDFAPSVQDLSAQGFPLIGGRLDYLDNRAVAALVYKRREHPINLFMWPVNRASAAGQGTLDRQGYHLVHWRQGGMNYWAISDLDVRELEEFARLLQSPPN